MCDILNSRRERKMGNEEGTKDEGNGKGNSKGTCRGEGNGVTSSRRAQVLSQSRSQCNVGRRREMRARVDRRVQPRCPRRAQLDSNNAVQDNCRSDLVPDTASTHDKKYPCWHGQHNGWPDADNARYLVRIWACPVRLKEERVQASSRSNSKPSQDRQSSSTSGFSWAT